MPDLSEGSIIAGCAVEAVAGRGGMGVVYRATQLALRRPVAVKAIAADLAQDADYRERFERESRLAASIDHPNVIPVYEAGDFEGTLYLIMRWVDGTDLRTLLHQSSRLAPARAVRVLRPVAAALAAAHRAGLVHRDIKPANVLIARGDTEDDEHVYLTDFGIARRTSGESAMTRTGMFVGTIDYTAPERIEGGKGDAASDVYSFGCMLFETLTGHVPYDRPSEVAKVFAHMNDPVPAARAEVPEVPEALDSIIGRAMAKDPAGRFATGGELVAALGELLRDLETEERERITAGTAAVAPATAPAPTRTTTAVPAAPPVPPSEVRVHRLSRRGRAAALAGGLLALVVAILAIALSGGPSASVSGGGMGAGPPIDLGGQPAALSVGPTGNLWASLPDDGEVVRVDAASGRTVKFPVGGHPGAIAASRGGLWVAGGRVAPLARYNLRTGRLEYSAQLSSVPRRLAVDPSDLTVWAVDAHGAATHLSPTGAVLGMVASLGATPLDMTAGEGGWLWSVNGELLRLGAKGAPAMFSVGADPVAVTLDQGVWTAHGNGHVTRFDPRPHFLNVNTDVRIAPSLDGISAIESTSTVWTISRQTKTLYRLSTAPGAPIVGRVMFSGAPVALAAEQDGVWVATDDGHVTEIAG